MAVHGASAAALLETTRCLPLLAWRRARWEVLRPVCGLGPAELAELDAAGVWAAGFVDDDVLGRPELYDVLLHAGGVRTSPSGAGLAPPAPLVAEVGAVLAGAAARGGAQAEAARALAEALAAKHDELLARARALPAGGGDGDEAAGVAPFLRRLAEAEGGAGAGA